ncbi:uncharacterized protein LOC125839052 [Solanum verrucosum]|uniref:uncharacterized protein LOC125839052 n=1 Tax=Solanum verrucosum TaxID=315347 RepID=UPI0020D00654|nr:uncharacterized protein LOC125839052 [Solanum verrucosum]
MTVPPNMEEGQSSTKPSRFNGQYYGWWKNRMHDYINAEDSELWDIILMDHIFLQRRKDYNEADRKKNYKAKKIMVCGIGADEYNIISSCETAKEIWDYLQTAHEGTQRVKESKVDILTTQYENFVMKEGETIFEMNSRFTSITNELRCQGEPIPVSKQIRKILKVLPKSWESNVDAITEAKDLMTLPMDELIGNLQTYELNKKQETTVKEGMKEKSIALRTSQTELTEEENEMVYVTRRFHKIIKKHRGFQKKTSASRTATANDLFHKCGKPGYFMRDCPSQKQKTRDTRPRKRDLVPDHARRNAHADQLVRKAFVLWGNDSSESEEDVESDEYVSMMAIEDNESVFNSIFSLMAKSDDEDDSDEVTLFDLKDDLDVFPVEKLRKLVSLLIDSVDERTNENLMLNEKLSLCEDDNSALMSQVSEMSVRIGTLETSNITPKEDPEEINESVLVHGQWMLKAHDWRYFKLLSLKAHHGGGVSFGGGKKGYILGIGKIGRSVDNSINNVHYGKGLKYNLLSISQICDKGNEVKFMADKCLVTNCITKRVVMSATRVKNMYVADLDSIKGDDLSCLSA